MGFDITLEDFQAPFYTSKAKFPGCVMGWGTGKTMLGILKGLLLSQVYPNNYGLIVRKRYVDLRDSTLKDFERYTGLRVNKSDKEVTIPGTKSTIIFRHGDELDSLQNVNLGWFMIEQAEEFDNADGFDQLRGRLRRDLEVDNKFMGGPRYGEYVEWLKDNPWLGGWIIANANGHNWCWRRWVQGIPGAEQYEGFTASTFDNHANLPDSFLKDLKALERDNPKKYRRYVMNSQEEQEVEGAQYEAVLDMLSEMGRVSPGLYRPDRQVHWVIDPGYHTAIIMFQIVNQSPYLVRAYESVGEGVEGVIDYLDKCKGDYGYRYGQAFAPYDIDNNAAKAVRATTLLDEYSQYGIRLNPLPLERKKVIGIARTQSFLKTCFIDSEGCDIGLQAWRRYRLKKNETMSTEEHAVFLNVPEEGWEHHLSDALRYLSLCVHMVVSESDGMTDDYEAEAMASSYVTRTVL